MKHLRRRNFVRSLPVKQVGFSISLILAFSSGIALANPCGAAGTIQEKIVDCATANPRSSEKVSSNNIRFTLVSEDLSGSQSWQDTKTALVWHDMLQRADDPNHANTSERTLFTFDDARSACGNLGLRLPTLAEFTAASSNGFEVVVPNLMESFPMTANGFLAFYWTGTELPDNFGRNHSNGAYAFHSHTERSGGNITWDSGTFIPMDKAEGIFHARCVE